jgi:ubiquinone/menaquinone biosynthesis C-methylase UbiE
MECEISYPVPVLGPTPLLLEPTTGHHYGVAGSLISLGQEVNASAIQRQATEQFSSIRSNPCSWLPLFLDPSTDQGSRRTCNIEKQVYWFNLVGIPIHQWNVIDPACGPGVFASVLKSVGVKTYLGLDRESAFISFASALDLGQGFTFISGESPSSLGRLPSNSFTVALLTYEVLNGLDDADITKWLKALHRLLTKGGFLFGDFRALGDSQPLTTQYSAVYDARRGSPFTSVPHRIHDTLFYNESLTQICHKIQLTNNDRTFARILTRFHLIDVPRFCDLCVKCGFTPVTMAVLFPTEDAGFILPSPSITFACQRN